MKATLEGMITDKALALYLSEKYPQGSRQRAAKMYGGADKA